MLIGQGSGDLGIAEESYYQCFCWSIADLSDMVRTVSYRPASLTRGRSPRSGKGNTDARGLGRFVSPRISPDWDSVTQ